MRFLIPAIMENKWSTGKHGFHGWLNFQIDARIVNIHAVSRKSRVMGHMKDCLLWQMFFRLSVLINDLSDQTCISLFLPLLSLFFLPLPLFLFAGLQV